MIKIVLISVLLVFLTACGAPESFETVTDQLEVLPPALKLQPVVDLPGEEIRAVFGQEDLQMYFCEDYTLSIETRLSGDLQQTLLDTTGFSPEQLQLLETGYNGVKRYTGVWSGTGEQGDEINRVCILDDGSYHYILIATAPAGSAGALSAGQWQQVFGSFRLLSPEQSLNTGS